MADPRVDERAPRAHLLDRPGVHPREVVHQLGAAILTETGGDLRDDATMVCLDWYGPQP